MKILQNEKFYYLNNVRPGFKGKTFVEPLIRKSIYLPGEECCQGLKYGLLKKKDIINFDGLKALEIPNLHFLEYNGVRGESLSFSKNCKFLSHLKENGIDTIIDLKTSDYSPKFKTKCDNYGLKYIHIPIDGKSVSDREILDNLPTLFRELEKGHFYIACAQGRHRTDIALALNYMFNPKHSSIPPRMYGHIKPNEFRCQNIFTRINSLYKAMTVEDKAKLGWTEEFAKNFEYRKKHLKTFNENFVVAK